MPPMKLLVILSVYCNLQCAACIYSASVCFGVFSVPGYDKRKHINVKGAFTF